MAENALQIEVRDAGGKGPARRLRAAGRIPGVCYGKGRESVSIALDPTRLRKLLEKSDAGMNTLINLQGGVLDGTMVLVKELQRDPVRGAYLHADFYTVDLQQKVEVSVPVHITGVAVGVENSGGVLDQALREIELECLPLSIPRELVADVTNLEIGDSIHVRDIVLPDGVELACDPNLSVISVVAPMKEEEVAAVEEGVEEGAEPAEGEAAAEGKDEDGSGEGKGEEKSGD